MGLFDYSYKQDAYSTKGIEKVQIIKILYQSLELQLLHYSSKDLADNTAFVCLVVYTDGTKRMDVVNLDDMNAKYVNYLVQSDFYSV